MRKLGLVVLTVGVLLLPVQADILLSDIVGGGDGSGNAPAENVGINPDTGDFATASINADIWNTDDGLVPVSESVE